MSTTQRYISTALFAIYSFICFLFFYKYSHDVHAYLVALVAPYLGALYYFTFQTKGKLFSANLTKYIVIGLNVALVVVSAIGFQLFSVEGLTIDRYSVVTNYWDAYFLGENPYSSKSHAGNHYGSYPFYFWTMLPFYLFGELGWAAVSALLIFQSFVYRYFKSYAAVLVAFILSIGSIALPYEIATRSSIFYNSTLVLIAAYFFYQSWKKENKIVLILAAFFIGCLVSSRPIFGLVFAQLGIFLCRTRFDLQKVSLAAVASIVGAILPFLHLYTLFPETFIQYNPVSYTAVHFVPMWMQVVFLIVGLALAFRIKSFPDFIQCSTYLLLFVVFAYMMRHFVLRGWYRAIFGNFLDLTYFILPLPFLIVCMLLSIFYRQKSAPRISSNKI